MNIIDKVIQIKIDLGCIDRYDALVDIKRTVDELGIYYTAKRYNVLVNESGEDFAMQFMSAYNNEVKYTY